MSKEPTAADSVRKAVARLILLAAFAGIAYWAYGLLRPLFNGPAITYWQMFAAVWLLRVAKNLFTL